MSDNPVELTAAFPERLRQLRRQRDWSQGQLANQAEIETRRASKHEMVISTPPLEVLICIARALDVSLAYLLTGKSSKSEKLKNAKLIERIEDLENFPLKYQETLVFVLESFIKRHKFEELAHS